MSKTMPDKTPHNWNERAVCSRCGLKQEWAFRDSLGCLAHPPQVPDDAPELDMIIPALPREAYKEATHPPDKHQKELEGEITEAIMSNSPRYSYNVSQVKAVLAIIARTNRESRIDELKAAKRNNMISAELMHRVDRRIAVLESQQEANNE